MTSQSISWRCLALLVIAASPASGQTNPMDSIRKLPSYRSAHDSVPLLSSVRLDSLPPQKRAEWKRYIERSRRRYLLDTIAMRTELVAAGKTRLVRAQYSAGFEITRQMTAEWFGSDSAQGIARNILSYQAPNGGWSKHVDVVSRLRKPGESFFSESDQWQWISTIDNGATISQMRFLAQANSARANPQYRTAFIGGVEYLLASQFQNGCWPQVWPLQGSYHDAATFNDDASLNAARLLKEVGGGRYSFVPGRMRAASRKAVTSAIRCILAAQAKVKGRLTAWGQQHDPLTLAPTSARSYELTSLTAQESANIMRFLIETKNPSKQIVESVHAAADWLAAIPVYGFTFAFDTGLEKAEGAGPLWARMYEIGTNRPIFSDRNGIKLYDWNQLNDRRHGYGWYTYTPVDALKKYERWAVTHPRQK